MAITGTVLRYLCSKTSVVYFVCFSDKIFIGVIESVCLTYKNQLKIFGLS